MPVYSTQKLCIECGSLVAPSTGGRGVCRRCYMRAYGAAHRVPAPRFSFTCAYCEIAFEGRPLRNAKRRFCSVRCGDDYNSREQRTLRVPKRRPKRQSSCPLCGATFTHLASDVRIYCSPECYRESRRLRSLTARESPHDRRASRYGARVAALALYGTCCQICGWNRGDCETAHLVARADGGSDRVENLAILCHNCHWLLDHDRLTEDEARRLPQLHTRAAPLGSLQARLFAI